MNLAINRKSWMLKIANYGGLEVDDRTDLCSLFWSVLWGILRAPFWVISLGILGATAIGLAVGIPIIGLIAYFAEGLAFQLEVWLVLTLWAIAAWGLYEAWASEKGAKASVTGTIRLAVAGYRSWKEKTCVLIDVR